MKRRNEIRVVLAVALLLATPVAASGAALAGATTESAGATGPAQAAGEPGDEPTNSSPGESIPQRPTNGSVEPMTACFTGGGYPISIGETGATLDALIHLSVLTDPAVGNEFGVEAAGTLDDKSVVTLAAGVRLTAREAIADGVDPFAAFDILYTYELRLPIFGGSIDETEYRDSGSPFRSSADVVPC